MIKLIVFDMDGLLLDTEKVYYEGWLAGAQKNNLNLDVKAIKTWGGLGIKQALERLQEMVGDETLVDCLREERENYIYQQLKDGQIKMKPFAREVLEKCRLEGLTTALATSSPQERGQAFLEYFAIDQLFNYKTFGNQVRQVKPDPEIYLTSFAKAGAIPDEAIAVEDSFYGALSATRAGCSVVLIPDKSSKSKFSEDQKAQLNILEEGETLQALIHVLDKKR